MLADVLVRVAGFEKEDHGLYAPRPSLAGPERCLRQMVYWANGTPEDRMIGDRFIMVLDDSGWHEHLTADWIRQSAYTLHSEQMHINTPMGLDFLPERICKAKVSGKECGSVIPAGNLGGHVDGIVKDMLDNETHYEHKAINRFAFERYWKKEQYPLDYFTQSCIYQKGIRLLLPHLTRTCLLIKCKDTSQYMDCLLEYDVEGDTVHLLEVCHSNGEKNTGDPYLFTMENVVNGASEKFRQVDHHVQDMTLPDRPFEFGTKFPCGYCSWEETCWEGYEEEFTSRLEEGVLPEDFIDNLRYYLELNMHLSEMEKEKDKIRDGVLEELKKQNAKKAVLGEYTVTIRLQSRTSLDREAPPELLKRCTKQTFSEVLIIRKPKEKK